MTLAQRATKRNVTVNHLKPTTRFGASALSAGLFAACVGLMLIWANPTQAAFVDGGKGPQLLIGLDDDRQVNTAIQAGAATNQSLDRTDVLEGGPGNDMMLGLNETTSWTAVQAETSSSADWTVVLRQAAHRTATSCLEGLTTT